MKKYLLLIAIFYGNFTFAQLNETFITNTAAWTGSNSGNDFVIVNDQLRSNSIIASNNFYLSAQNTLAANCQWEFYINLQFNTSGANYVDFYLTSNQSNLQTTAINGYFVRIGNTNDEICLYKRSGAASSSSILIDGVDGILNTSNNKIKIRVTRTSDNIFTLERDITGSGTSYFTEGTVKDASHTTSSYFGFFIQQSTASFHQKHFFDDIKISPIITDTSPPELISVLVKDSTTLEITFNEHMDSLSAKEPANYLVNNNQGSPILVKTTADPSKYVLKLPKGLNTATYTISTSNIADKAGNIISTNNTLTFSYVKPFIAQKGDLVINEIFADPSPQIDLPSVEYIELFNASTQTIQLKNWKYSDPASTATFAADSIKAGEYFILCAKADTNEFKQFGKTLGISPWPSLNNSSDIIKLISPDNTTIDSVSYSDTWHTTAAKKQGGWSLERIDFASVCKGLFNWSSSVDVSGGTPGKQNSVFIVNYDQLAFKADSMRKLSDSTLVVYFNKPTDISQTLTSFVLSPASGNIKSVIADNVSKQVRLLFNNKFAGGTTYTLSLSELKDCAGNTIVSNSFEFTTPKLPPVRLDTSKILITEIFADPSPEVKLPLVEFVEIYNPSKDTIDLEGWTLHNSKTKSTFKKSLILPNEYLILCPIADTTQYLAYGKVIGLSSWPALTNTADQISLKSFKERLVDSITYSDSWHTNSAKKQGGWSLERIDFASICKGLFNWSSSVDASGGTPGKRNSVFIENYDQLAFEADSIKRPSDSTLVVYFNKPADVSSSSNAFTLSPASGALKFIGFDTYLKQATIFFSEKFKPNTTYTVNINQLKDCAGNTIIANSYEFTTPKLPPVRLDTAKILITEIFADPSPEVKLPLTEFVEIYNPGKDTIDLEGWTLHNSKTKSTFKKSLILPNEYLILCPVADTTHYLAYGKVIGLSSWPALTNTADQISLKSFKERLVDSITYTDSWHTSSAKKQGGWSLERIDFASVCKGLFNWSSSVDASGGTPGKRNSVFIENYDQLAFKADSIKRPSDSTLVVYFNKPADVSSSSNAFTLSPASGDIKSVTTDDVSKQVRLLFSNKFAAGTTYTLSLNQLKDCAGNTIASNSFEFTTPKLPPVRLDTAKIYITEIFADPSPEVKLPLTEFIEIYNPGKDTIDLEGWTLHNSKTKSTFKKSLILPNEYLILCPIADTTQYLAYGKVIGLSSWPALTNTADQVILKSFKERLVDSITYADSWHTTSAKKQGGWSLERMDYTSICKGLFNWTSSVDVTGGTPGKRNSVFIENYDQLAFKADSMRKLSDSTLIVYFNKPADVLTANNAFSILPVSGNIKSVLFDAYKKQCTILFSEKFAANTSYKITINQLKDCAGNTIASNSFEFTTPKLPPVRLDTAKILITEIFADPSPEVKLPLTEFIEIYNSGKDTINLEGWTISDPTSRVTIKKASILPQQYIILCPAQDTLHYKPFGKTIGLSPWPSLNNASDQILLKSFTGRLSDSVAYRDSWYKDALKKAGGWSLELIDPLSVCTGSQNWIASIDSSGGTPGRENSVYKLNSSLPLRILQASVKDSSTISILFNKPPDSLSASRPDNFNINNGLGKPSAISFNKTLTEVQLHFSGTVARGNTYRVTSTGITDCSGSGIPSASNFAEFFFPNKIIKNSILVNEVLFNPRAGGVDFVEIYNNSGNTLDLQELSIASLKEPDSLVSIKNISSTRLLFPPKSYLVLTTDPDNIIKEYHTENRDAFLTMTSMPAFNNDAGTVVLLSAGNHIDQLNYTDKMHHALIKDPKGISLERINFEAPTNENGTFRSAAASSGYATPGYKNSQSIEPHEVINKEVSLLSETFSPDNDGFEDYLHISYRFKEAGIVANVNIYNDRGLLIKRLAKNTTLASTGSLTWDGMNDNGQRASLGIYIVYFEGFNIKGVVKKYKKACVLASKFN